MRFASGIALTLRDISDIKTHEQALADMASGDVLRAVNAADSFPICQTRDRHYSRPAPAAVVIGQIRMKQQIR